MGKRGKRITADHPDIVRAIQQGLVTLRSGPPLPGMPTPEAKKPPPEPREKPMVVGGMPQYGTFLLPIKTVSEANQVAWRQKSNRTKTARATVSKVLGKHLRTLADFSEAYHAGKVLKITFTRLGGKRLDSCNVSVSMKATEDAVALMLGADDGSPYWNSTFHQDTEYEKVGVLVVIKILD